MRALKAVFFCTLFIVWTVVSAHADSDRQDWMPSVLDLPADAEILTDREIGPTIRMFSISTAEDVDELLSRWRESLHAEGYVMFEEGIGSMERVIEFSGGGISNAKIIIAPSSIEGRRVVEFDATLN
jgi:hypothetical protein